MLYPRIQSISTKGQFVLSADVRADFKIKEKSLVLIIPDIDKNEVIIRPLATSDPIEVGFGMLAGKKSLTKALIAQRKQDALREKKHGRKLYS